MDNFQLSDSVDTMELNYLENVSIYLEHQPDSYSCQQVSVPILPLGSSVQYE